jgi:hypothetical protein
MSGTIKSLTILKKIKLPVLNLMMITCLMLTQASQTNAATVQVDASGNATSITGLTVGSVTYNIDFMYGFFDELFGGTLFADAPDISMAIRDALNALSPVPQDVFDPATTTSRFNPSGSFSIPYTNLTTISLDVVFSGFSNGTWLIGANSGISTLGTTGSAGTTMYAVPTLVNAVPLPAAFPLFLSALAGMGFFGWRRKHDEQDIVAHN